MQKQIITYLVALLAAMTFGVTAARADSGNLFTLVKKTSELKDGDTVVIVNKYKGVALSTSPNSSNNIGAAEVSFLDDDKQDLTISDDVQELVLQKSNSYWVFKAGSKYLCSKKRESTSSYLGKTSEIGEYTKTKIEVSTTNYSATINFILSYYKYLFVGINTELGKVFFACYTYTANNNYEVYLYKKTNKTATPQSITLEGNDSNSNNSTAINPLQGQTVDVQVNRTFIGDGGWYTLCLPFALSEDDIAEQFMGATFEGFKSVTKDNDGNVSLNFTKVTTTTAGTPYLVKPIDNTTITNPTFKQKTIDIGNSTVSHAVNDTGDTYSFIGIYDPTDISDDCNRFVNASGTELVVPEGSSKLKGLRAYFTLPSATSPAKMGIEGETSAISLPTAASPAERKGVYTLDGRYLDTDTQALPRGVYVVDGHKQMVK